MSNYSTKSLARRLAELEAIEAAEQAAAPNPFEDEHGFPTAEAALALTDDEVLAEALDALGFEWHSLYLDFVAPGVLCPRSVGPALVDYWRIVAERASALVQERSLLLLPMMPDDAVSVAEALRAGHAYLSKLPAWAPPDMRRWSSRDHWSGIGTMPDADAPLRASCYRVGRSLRAWAAQVPDAEPPASAAAVCAWLDEALAPHE
jgi:hypothetical protein